MIVPEIMIGKRVPTLVEGVLERIDRRLGVQRVEDRLDQQDVGAAFDQAERRLAIGGAQFVEGDGAKAGIVTRPARSTRCGWSGRSSPRRNGGTPVFSSATSSAAARASRAPSRLSS